jgi:hypothetical protein
MRYIRLIFVIPLVILNTSFQIESDQAKKICGVNYVSPENYSSLHQMQAVKRIHTNWIAICPFAFLRSGETTILSDSIFSWWGDRPEGLIAMCKRAKEQGIQILIKPHFIVDKNKWAGDFDLSLQQWKIWEKNYTDYILKLAVIADSLNVNMLSIGTEFKSATQNHPYFWEQLIDRIRKVYKGKLIYSANWDEYSKIAFWKKLDYIGIDAYFPLAETVTPSVSTLKIRWEQIIPQLKNISDKYQKQIIFTEYGYRSVHKAAWKQWEFEQYELKNSINLVAQTNAYQAFYETFWSKNWVAGGFIWKWYDDDSRVGGSLDTDYTPQHKPVETIIKKWYLQ